MCYNKGTVKQDNHLTHSGNTKVSIEKQASLERLPQPLLYYKKEVCLWHTDSYGFRLDRLL